MDFRKTRLYRAWRRFWDGRLWRERDLQGHQPPFKDDRK